MTLHLNGDDLNELLGTHEMTDKTAENQVREKTVLMTIQRGRERRLPTPLPHWVGRRELPHCALHTLRINIADCHPEFLAVNS